MELRKLAIPEALVECSGAVPDRLMLFFLNNANEGLVLIGDDFGGVGSLSDKEGSGFWTAAVEEGPG